MAGFGYNKAFTTKGLEANEGSDSSRLQRSPRALRLRQCVHDPLDSQRRHQPGNLLQLPPVLYRQAEAGGYRRTRGALSPQVREGDQEVKRQAFRGPPPRRRLRFYISSGARDPYGLNALEDKALRHLIAVGKLRQYLREYGSLSRSRGIGTKNKCTNSGRIR